MSQERDVLKTTERAVAAYVSGNAFLSTSTLEAKAATAKYALETLTGPQNEEMFAKLEHRAVTTFRRIQGNFDRRLFREEVVKFFESL